MYVTYIKPESNRICDSAFLFFFPFLQSFLETQFLIQSLCYIDFGSRMLMLTQTLSDHVSLFKFEAYLLAYHHGAI